MIIDVSWMVFVLFVDEFLSGDRVKGGLKGLAMG